MPELIFEKELPDVLGAAENLPSLPTVAVEVLRLTQDEDSTLDDLAGVLGQDPALASKLLKLSNSSLFGVGQEVTTLKRAAMVLGLKTVKLMSLSFSLAENFPKKGTGSFDHGEFWRRSLVAAVASRSLANRLGKQYGDECFLCGILSHMGQLVLSRCMPDDYEGVLEEAGGAWPTIQNEERVLGFHSSDVVGVLLQEWGLPPAVTFPVAFMSRPHELPADVDGDLRELCLLMAVASLVVSIVCDEKKGLAMEQLGKLGLTRFGFDAEEMDDFLMGLEPDIRETAEMLNVGLPPGMDHRSIIDQARLQIVDLSLDTTADLQRAERRMDSLEVRNRKLQEKASTDRLTGLHNRAAFDETLALEIDRRLTEDLPMALGLIMVDVDKFKDFNDTHGHLAGDAVLQMLGRVLKLHTRGGDLCARYGGEEFAIILPATTPKQLRIVSDRVRQAIEAEDVEFEGQILKVTASFGGACLAKPRSKRDAELLIKVADRFLYKAKENGRNRCEVYSQTDLPMKR